MLFEDGSVEAVREPLPAWVIKCFGALTDLGNPLVFVVLVSVVYWLTDHETGFRVVTALVLVFGLTVGLKELLAVERPPANLRYVAADGFGIPSGHAAGSVGVYGSLAVLYDAGPRWLRYTVAAVLAGLVSLSRLVIGVHYPVDVAAGIALGLAVVALVGRYRDRSMAPFLATGAAAALLGSWLGGFSYNPGLVLFGGAVAALAGWYALRPLPDPPRQVMAACGIVALPLVVGVSALGIAVVDSPVARVVVTAVAMGVVLATPLAGAVVTRQLERATSA